MRYETVPTFSVWLRDSGASGSTGRVAAMAQAFETGNAVNVPLARRSIELKAIDDLIVLYEKAWSPMAKRNLLVDLKRKLAAWGRANPAKVNLASVALQEVVNRLLETYPSSGKFTDVICTGWAIGCNYNANTGHTSPMSQHNPDYFAHSPNDQTDMLRKCSDMMAAIRMAKNAIAVQGLTDNDRTLKIFMAPEFYFRGQNGAYSPEIVSEIIPRLKKDIGPGWDDWLFVFGTAIASIVDEVTFCTTCPWGTSKITFERNPADRTKTIPKCDKDTGVGPAHTIQKGDFGAEVQNVALVYHAGESHMVAKEYVSGIDYKNRKVRVEPGTVNARDLTVLEPQGSNRSKIRSLFDDERMGGCMMNVAGLTVALEVCLDHIASATPSLGRASRYAGSTQLLLIPSYGMEIRTGLYCRNGGIVFNVDGRGLGKSDMAVKGGVRPTKTSTAVNGGRGTVEVWQPAPIPQ